MIGGNKTAIFQTKGVTQNDIGEDVDTWVDVKTVVGWLDLQSGDSTITTQNAKVQESTHIFVCGYFKPEGISPENSRMIVDSQVYEIKLIDNPMNMNEHLEIYLKCLGGDANVISNS